MTVQAGVTWAGVRDWLDSNGFLILIVLAAAVAVSWLSGIIVRRTRDRLEAASTATETVSLQRRATVTRLITNAVRVVIWAIAIVLILGQLNVDVSRVLFGAGLASLAIAFGLQPFLHDVVNGVFVAVENQYDVGDLVTLRIEGGIETAGWVRSVTFRSTELELDGGMTETIGHGKIVAARNRSRGRGRLVLDVRLPKDADAERVREKLDRTLREIKQDRRVARTFYTGPQLDRRETDGAEYLTISVETRPDRRDQVERALRHTLDRRLRSIDDRIEILEPESEAS